MELPVDEQLTYSTLQLRSRQPWLRLDERAGFWIEGITSHPICVGVLLNRRSSSRLNNATVRVREPADDDENHVNHRPDTECAEREQVEDARSDLADIEAMHAKDADKERQKQRGNERLVASAVRRRGSHWGAAGRLRLPIIRPLHTIPVAQVDGGFWVVVPTGSGHGEFLC